MTEFTDEEKRMAAENTKKQFGEPSSRLHAIALDLSFLSGLAAGKRIGRSIGIEEAAKVAMKCAEACRDHSIRGSMGAKVSAYEYVADQLRALKERGWE